MDNTPQIASKVISAKLLPSLPLQTCSSPKDSAQLIEDVLHTCCSLSCRYLLLPQCLSLPKSNRKGGGRQTFCLQWQMWGGAEKGADENGE